MKTLLNNTLFALAALSAGAPLAQAQTYPVKPVRFIIPFPPGGPTDLMGRTAANRLTKAFGVQFIADNRAGAGGNIGTELCAKSPPDGYTVCMFTVAQSISPAIYGKLGYDPLKDFAPVTLMAILPSMLTTHPSLPVKNVKELVALAKSRPGQMSYASTGNGTSPHMLMEMFKSMAGIDVVHIPYKGQAPAVVDQIAGQVQLAFNTAVTVLPHVQQGKLKPIAISTKERFPPMPDLPTVAESGVPGYEVVGWFGMFAPVGTPMPLVERLSAEAKRALQAPEVVRRAEAEGRGGEGHGPRRARPRGPPR